ncbi:MAG: prolyl oligopeptidase family serine peptidase [Pirellulales bacterium]
MSAWLNRIGCLGLVAATVFCSTWAWGAEIEPGKQVEAELRTADGGSISYLVYVPNNYKPASDQSAGDTKWPLLFFLHGRGESNGPLSLVAKWGPPEMVARGVSLKYIVVSPQCPRSDNWSSDKQQGLLVQLLDHIQSTLQVDPQRVYLAGLSMGGYGSWKLAAAHPDRFAAVVPICGGGNPADGSKLAQLPIWVWHGDQDTAVPLQKSTEMVEAIRAAGGTKLRFTTLEHVGHNSWSAAFGSPDLFEWLDKQHR